MVPLLGDLSVAEGFVARTSPQATRSRRGAGPNGLCDVGDDCGQPGREAWDQALTDPRIVTDSTLTTAMASALTGT
jgi:hypothetical protein